MKVHNVIQGTAEWLALRSGKMTASEAPVIMGASSKCTRTELVRMKATGDEKQYSDWVQKNLLDKGHEIEAFVRATIEDDLGEDLYPVTVTDDGDTMLASFDGLTIGRRIGLECKMWNKDLAAAVMERNLPLEYVWQLEHQMMVSGVTKMIFAVSDGTPTKFLQMEYVARPGGRAELLAGWQQFAADVRDFNPEPVVAEKVAATIKELPALLVTVEGRVLATNLDVFKASALEFIQKIKTDLQDDQDFADAERTVGFCKAGEERLEVVKAQALAQTATIDELFRTIDEISGNLRGKRLELEKLVKARKEQIRNEILMAGREAMRAFIDGLNAQWAADYMPKQDWCDFAGAMKGKRTVASLKDAVNGELANGKIRANAVATTIGQNLLWLSSRGPEAETEPDLAQLVLKEPEAMRAIVENRARERQIKRQQAIDAEVACRVQELARARQAPQETPAENAAPVAASPQKGRIPMPAAAPPTPREFFEKMLGYLDAGILVSVRQEGFDWIVRVDR